MYRLGGGKGISFPVDLSHFWVMSATPDLPQLNFPGFRFKIRGGEAAHQIFDPIRRKYVALTPEEWVRQHALAWLSSEKGFPSSLLASEMEVKLNGMSRRCDVVAHNSQAQPILIVECKAPEVKLTQATFDQAARYNIVLKVGFMMMTNGLQHVYCAYDHSSGEYGFLRELPSYSQMLGQ